MAAAPTFALNSRWTAEAARSFVGNPFSSYIRGRQLRSWVRFTHTGEAFGLGGQTVAALASAGASLLVFTGLALALRRLAGLKSRRGTKPEFREPGTIEAESLKSVS